MGFLRRVALPCGIVGGTWGVLAPIVLPVTVLLMGEEEISSLSGMAVAVRLWLSFVSLIGALGILAVIWIMRNHKLRKLGRPLLWTSALAILLASFVDIAIGLFFLPAAVLLAVAALGLFREELGCKA